MTQGTGKHGQKETQTKSKKKCALKRRKSQYRSYQCYPSFRDRDQLLSSPDAHVGATLKFVLRGLMSVPG